MKVLYIQYGGDFAEAYSRLILQNGEENYYAQRYSVEAVVQQARRGISVCSCVLMAKKYNLILEENLCAVGLGFSKGKIDYKSIKHEIHRFSPDRVILRIPNSKLLSYLRINSIPTLPVFADSFENIRRIRQRWNTYLLAKELRHKSIKWVANHQLNAAISLKNLGVSPKKILPYDWKFDDNPKNWAKKIPDNISEQDLTIFFAGTLIKSKGIYDLVRSVKIS